MIVIKNITKDINSGIFTWCSFMLKEPKEEYTYAQITQQDYIDSSTVSTSSGMGVYKTCPCDLSRTCWSYLC